MKENRVTIRNIDPEVLQMAREIVCANRHDTMGSFVTDALFSYIEMLPDEDEGEESVAA